MKFVAAIFIFCFVSQFNYAQIVNTIKKSNETQATDFNRTRSNKEHLIAPESTNPSPPIEDIQESKLEKELDTSIHTSHAEYIFDTKILFKVLNFENTKVRDSSLLIYTFNDSVFMFNSSAQGLAINDYKLKKMFMLDAASKSGVSNTLISPEIMKMTYQAGVLKIKYLKTGKSKSIAGHTCHEYTYTYPQTRQISIWVCSENPLKDKNDLATYNMDLFFMNLGVMSPEAGSIILGLDFANEKGEIMQSTLYQSMFAEENKFNLGEYKLISY